MSPLKWLFQSVGGYFLLLIPFLGFLAALAFPWGEPYPTAMPRPLLVSGFFALLTVFVFCMGVLAAVRAASVLQYCGRPTALLDQMKWDLDSPIDWKRRRALQILADHHGHPFGRVSCWPSLCHTPIQIRNMILLYKEWLQISKEVAGDETLLPHIGPLRQAVAKALDRASEAVKDAILDVGAEDDEEAPEPLRRPLPPVEAIRLAAALREPVERTLTALADRVNAARDLEDMAASEKEICDLFDALAHHALELAAGLRVDVAADRLPWTGGRGEWARKFRRMTAMESVVEPGQEP